MTIDFCEETCTLTAPVSVRDMAGTLFDLQCRSDHGDSLRRVLLLEQTDHDGTRRLSWIDTQETRAIVPCP